jgi:hypothetical protein
MSKGRGQVESRIAELFAATRDRALTVAEIADNAYGLGGRRATRAQRLSATRAGHRLLRRIEDADKSASKYFAAARLEANAAAGERPAAPDTRRASYDAWKVAMEAYAAASAPWEAAFKASKFRQRAEALRAYARRLGGWQATTVKGGLYFHPPDVPIEVWAVRIDRSGVHWFGAEITKITERNVMVRYAGEPARLDRFRLFLAWAWWRGVMFVSSRTGRIAAKLDEVWQGRYGRAEGGAPPAMRMPLDEARRLLGLPLNYTRDEVIAAFRRAVKKAHPDLGGTAEMFHKLVEARDRLLAALGTSEPAPKAPAYAPSGMTVVYRSGGSRRQSLGSTRRLSAT